MVSCLIPPGGANPGRRTYQPRGPEPFMRCGMRTGERYSIGLKTKDRTCPEHPDAGVEWEQVPVTGMKAEFRSYCRRCGRKVFPDKEHEE